jgi:hypothetical protein
MMSREGREVGEGKKESPFGTKAVSNFVFPSLPSRPSRDISHGDNSLAAACIEKNSVAGAIYG